MYGIRNNHRSPANAGFACLVMSLSTCLVASLLGGCGSSGEASEVRAVEASTTTAGAPAGSASADSGDARIEFTEYEHDFGTIWDVEKQTHNFEFTNTGPGTLIIEDIKASCGCTATKLEKREYAPGEGSSIEVTFSPKGFGKQTKRVTVVSNGWDEPNLELRISAKIKPFIEVNPVAARFGTVDLGSEQTKTLQIRSMDPQLEVIEVTATSRIGTDRNDYVTATYQPKMPVVPNPDEEGRTTIGSVELTLSGDTPWGQLYGSFNVKARGRVEAGGEIIEHEKSVTISARIAGKLTADNDMFRIGAVPPGGSFAKEIEIKGAVPFRIVDAEIVGCRFPDPVLEAVQLDDDTWTIKVSGDAKKYFGSIGGRVVLTTDVPGEERLEFELGGLVRAPPS